MMRRTVRHDSTDRSLAPDRIDSTLANEPIENAEQNEPTLPIDKADPIDPIDSTEPLDPMHSTESVERIDRTELPRFIMGTIIYSMTAKTRSDSSGFSAAERAAMKARAAELKAEGKAATRRADGLQAVTDAIAKMGPDDRALAQHVHDTVTATLPALFPKTWYGMPAYTNDDGKVVVFFQDAGKFNYRYATLGFQDEASLDDGDIWPVSYALKKWSPAMKKKIVELLKAAVSA
jgi:uncharacterized protein YdhG (YjbR/CyaY superfamily)